MDASDSPSLSRILVVALPSALSTSSLREACVSSRANESPLAQFTAFNPTTYWLPRLLIEPARTAALPVRSQISRAVSRVMRPLGERPIRRSVSLTRWLERIFKQGD